MLLDMVNEDVAYIPRYAHIRGNNRKDALDTFGHLAVYIDMGTVGCRDVYQILIPITTRFLFLFRGFTRGVFSDCISTGSAAGAGSGFCRVRTPVRVVPYSRSWFSPCRRQEYPRQ